MRIDWHTKVAKIRTLLARGFSIGEIADYYLVPKSTMQYVIYREIADYKALMMTDAQVAEKIDIAYKKMFPKDGWMDNNEVFGAKA